MDLDSFEIPDKAEFKIGEVAKLLDLEPYVLRYWEDEFERLSPEKTQTGQRVYRRNDIALLAQIRHLLYTEKFTIKGACRQFELADEGKSPILGDGSNFAQQNLFVDESTSTDNAENDKKLQQDLKRLKNERKELQKRIKNLKDEVKRLRRKQQASPGSVPSSANKIINFLDSDISDLESIFLQ